MPDLNADKVPALTRHDDFGTVSAEPVDCGDGLYFIATYINDCLDSVCMLVDGADLGLGVND